MSAFRPAAFPVLYDEPMAISRRREAFVLFFGDLCALVAALFLTMFARYSSALDLRVVMLHLEPFSFLFLASVVVFFISGMYEKHTLPMKEVLPATIFYAQLANVIIAAAFFFLVPAFEIQPKAFLFVYLLFSVAIVTFWRMYLFPLLSLRRPQPAVFFGQGEEAEQIFKEVNGNTRYAIYFERLHGFSDGKSVSPDDIRHAVTAEGASTVVLPYRLFQNRELAAARSDLMREGVQFMDQARLYEELFDRVDLHAVDERLFDERNASADSFFYAAVKRIIDVILSALALIVLSPLFLAVFLVLKSGGGNALIFQERIGRGNRVIKIIKFRTMLFDDGGDPEKQKKNKVTAFGAFLRKTQIDEMPQFWNVIVGDLSLVGPRPEIPSLVAEYEKQIPYYGARHTIQPGISGWAQIKHASPPKWKLDVEATGNKLSYDLYYLKNRSIALDSMVILRTVQILLSRAGK